MYLFPLNKSLIITFLCLCFTIGLSQETEQIDTEKIRNKQRVSYVYNFTNYIDWEQIESNTIFKIGILGTEEEDLIKEFKTVAAKKTIKSLPVAIKSFQSIESIEPTHILYLNAKYDYDINQILALSYLNNCLLITEGYPFQISMINFIELDNEFHFEMSEGKINRAQLLVDPALASFSIRSTADWNLLYDKLQNEKSTVKEQKVELDRLGVKIKEQKQEIVNQQEQLQQTINEIENQQLLLSKQEKIILEKNNAINKQVNRLTMLTKKIEEQLKINKNLVEVFQNQQDSIFNQQEKINTQNATLSAQNEAINQKELEIAQKNDTLKIKLSEIEQQRFLLYMSVAFIILIISFSIIVYRSYIRRKKSEQALQVKNKELIALNRSLDSFTYRVSHDLKAPVINVQNMIKMLEKFTDKSAHPMTEKIFENLHLSSNRLQQMITDLLELTRIERVKEQKTSFELHKLTTEIADEFKDEIKTINGKLEINISTDLTLYASTVEIGSIFRNLLTNSIKYRAKERNLSVKIDAQVVQKECKITYQDNGTGIDIAKFKDKLFGMFERFSSDSKIAGTGVGMYIIKKMVDNNEGTIELDSELGNGLVYTFHFPLIH